MLSSLFNITSNYTITRNNTIPKGYFTFTANMFGIQRTYLLAGNCGDPQAMIVGHLVPASNNGRITVYAGSGVTWTTFLGYADTPEEAFARMVTMHGWLQDEG